jgi:CRP/FNR family cyclic AMP-dependent transcriptional regulator
LARLLLLLAKFGKDGTPEPIVGKVNQEMLSEMIGSTRSRVSHFMNKFRELGYISYSDGKIEVRNGLLNVLLHDKPHIRGDDTLDLNEPMSLALSRGKLGGWQV